MSKSLTAKSMTSKTAKQIRENTGVGNSVIETLVKKNVITKVDSSLAAEFIDNQYFNLNKLSDKQSEAYSHICKQLNEKKHFVTVIDGVTGSGKTEVYFHTIAKIFEDNANNQILILLPEIVLTSQLIKRFEEQFGFKPAIWNNQVTKAKKRDIFNSVSKGNIRVVVGARSALFLPFKSLALIIVDEEHESSFKQEDMAVYHGRDMAIVRAKINNIPVILSSATPSLETIVNVKTEKYTELKLPSRFGNAAMPKVELIDMRLAKLEKNHYISQKLKQELANTLSANKQAMLYLNRRGYAPLILCKACGHKIQCPNCTSCLTQHNHIEKLLCHHCGFFMAKPKNCPKCEVDESLIPCGPGVERIQEEVKKYFPEARIVIMTSDTIKDSSDAQAIFDKMLAGNIDFIIGTQLIAKGHHFPKLTLVGIIDSDNGLFGGDFRAAEKTYQLLSQVAGRAGREQDEGRVLIQSYSPDNVVLKTMLSGNRNDFIEFEEKNRQMVKMPPFGKLVAVIMSGINENLVVENIKEFSKQIPYSKEVEVFGPAPAPISRLNNRYRYRLLIHTAKNINVQKMMRGVMEKIKLHPSIRVKIDVDPYGFF